MKYWNCRSISIRSAANSQNYSQQIIPNSSKDSTNKKTPFTKNYHNFISHIPWPPSNLIYQNIMEYCL